MLIIKGVKERISMFKKSEYKCPICKDKKLLYVMKDGYEIARKCDCVLRQEAIERIERSGIIEEDRNKTLDDYMTYGKKPLEYAKQTVKIYMESFNEIKNTRNNSLLLMGKSGSGKTMLGIIAAMHIVNEHSTSLLYVSYRTMVTKLKQNIMDEYTYNLELGKIISSPLIFIDDLFKGKITESDINIMYEIINTRYLERKPIIISTECGLDELLEIDEAIGSRIIEMSKNHIVMFDDSTTNHRMR